MTTNVVSAYSKSAIKKDLIGMVSLMMEDCETEYPDPVSDHTNLITDLGFSSIDIVMLVGAIHRRYGRSEIPFEQLFPSTEEAVRNATIGVLTGFLFEYLNLSDEHGRDGD
jgi:acyl carrier protein